MPTTPRLRAGAAAAVITAGLVSACGGDDSAASGDLERITFISGAKGSYTQVPLFFGQDADIFAEHGIEADVTYVADPSTVIAAVQSGSAQAALINPVSVAQARSKGLDVSYFCGWTPITPQFLVGSQELESIEEVGSYEAVLEQLEGRTVGVAALGSGQQSDLEAAMSSIGMAPDAVTFVATGLSTGPAALGAGQVDAIVTSPLIAQVAVAQSGGKELLLTSRDVPVLKDAMSAGWIGATDWIEANKELAGELCAALGDSLEATTDPAVEDQLNDVLTSAEFNVPEDALGDVRPLFAELLGTDVPESHLVKTLSNAVDAGLIESAPPYSEMFTSPN